MALPRSALLLLPLLLLSSAQAQKPISMPPSSAPTASPRLHPHSPAAPSQPPSADAADTAPSPPADSPAPAHLHPAAPAPAPASAADDGDDDDDEYYNKEKEKGKGKERQSPAPAPAAEEIKAGAGGEQAEEPERHGGALNSGKKAGVVVGAFTAAAVVGVAAVVWRKRQSNIRRSRYADYSARLELV